VDTTTGDEFGLSVDDVGCALSLPNVLRVGASVANFLVGDIVELSLDGVGMDVFRLGTSTTNFSDGDCVGVACDDVGFDTTVDGEFGVLVDGVGVGLIFEVDSEVGASDTDLSVGDDSTGLSLEGFGPDAPVGDEVGLLVGAVGCTPGVGGPVINW